MDSQCEGPDSNPGQSLWGFCGQSGTRQVSHQELRFSPVSVSPLIFHTHSFIHPSITESIYLSN